MFGLNDGTEGGEVVLNGAADDDVTVARPLGHFGGGALEAVFDFLGCFCAALEEAAAEFFYAGRDEEDVHQGIADLGVGAGADGFGTGGVNIQQHVAAFGEGFEDGGFEGAVAVLVDGGVFEEFPCGDTGGKFFFGEEVVILAIDLAWPGLARGAGDGVNEILALAEGVAEGGFARAGGGGEDKEDAAAAAGQTQRWEGLRGGGGGLRVRCGEIIRHWPTAL